MACCNLGASATVEFHMTKLGTRPLACKEQVPHTDEFRTVPRADADACSKDALLDRAL